MIRLALFFILISFFIISCAPANSKEDETQEAMVVAEPYAWTKLTADAGYSKTYNYQLFARDSKLWAFHMDAAWVSEDGKTWRKTELTNIVQNQKYLDYIEFNDAIYALGTFAGKASQPEQTTQIARTSDMKTWEILTKKSNLPARFSYHPFVFKKKIWIMGGRDEQTIYGDAWNSADAIHWEKVADDLPFGAQDEQRFVVFNDRLYMLAKDVWVSDDGLKWEQLVEQLTSDFLYGYEALVFDNKIWLIGNYRDGKLGSEVLYSTDGKTWKTQTAPWSPRGGVAACVFNNQIIMTGGKYGGQAPIQAEFEYNNDVWAMLIK